MTALKMEFLLFLRHRSVLIMCAAYLLVSLIALFLGAQTFYNEQKQLAELESHYSDDIQSWKRKVDEKGEGYAAYYLFNPVVLTASPWSALFAGENKENVRLQRVRLLAVHGQIHGSPIVNSQHAVSGVLDLQFVWLYLLPLLIGLTSVTCVADDRRLGRWPLVSALTKAKTLVTQRLLVRLIAISAINFLVLALAYSVLPIALDREFFVVVSTMLVYQVFWILVSAIIVFLFLNARQSILMFVGIWIISAWLVPAIHYSSALDSDTYNTGIELLVNQRQDMNDSWDRDKNDDFQKFLEQHPEWKATAALGDAFEWKWYFAMQKRSDDLVAELAGQYMQNRRVTNTFWQWFSPTLVAQHIYEDAADTSAADYQDWLDSVIAWHNQIQNFWFPYFFKDKQFEKAHLDAIPEFYFVASDKRLVRLVFYEWAYVVLAFLILVLLNKRNLEKGAICHVVTKQ